MTNLEFDGVSFGYRLSGGLVLESLSLSVPPGPTALLGPNGAGKSTMLSLAAAVHRPRDGSIRMGPIRSTARDYRRLVSWLPQTVAVVPGNTAREQVALSAWLKGHSKRAAWDRAEDALRQVDLGDVTNEKAASLSGGQRARLGLAQALVHEPSLMLLDEPTASLDPHQRSLFTDVLRGLKPSMVTLVSTHDVHDLDEVYESVVVLNHGRVLFQGSVQEFLRDDTGVPSTPTEAYARHLGVRA